MNLFNIFQKSISSKTPEYHEETFFVVGVQYYFQNLQKLACPNSDYKKNTKSLASSNLVMKKIYQNNYINKPVKLIPDPRNPHDKHAVAVYIAGELVGYISQDDNKHIKNILSSADIQFISSFVSGGKYKVVSSGGNVEKLDQQISIKVKIGYRL